VFLWQILSADMLTPQAGCSSLTDSISRLVTLVVIFHILVLTPDVIYVTQFLVLCFILSMSTYSLLASVKHFNKLN
jgi:hypothetical protein